MPTSKNQLHTFRSDGLVAVVLGANGFLGASLVKQLLLQGHRVVAVSRSKSNDGSPAHSKVKTMLGDVRVQSVLESAFTNADIVFHTAGSTHPTLNLTDPAAEIEMAVLPLITVMNAAKKCGIKKIVYPSSGGTIYADQSAPRTETTALLPQTPYAIFKLTSEQLLLSAALRGDFAVEVLRIANLYGPGQPKRPGQGVLPHWISAIKSGRAVTLFGDGTAERDYVYIDDAAYCLASSCQRLNRTDVYNVGTGIATSLADLITLLHQTCPKPFSVDSIPARPSDIQSISLDASKLTSDLTGFSWMSLEQGLRKVCNQEFGLPTD